MRTGRQNLFLGELADIQSGNEANRSVIIGSGARMSEVDNSIAIGYQSSITNDYALTIGSQSLASGLNSISIGRDTKVINSNSIAIGNQALSSGENAIAIGFGAQASIDNQIVLGNNSITEVTTGGVMKANSFLATGTNTTYADYVFEDYYNGSSKIKSNYTFNTLETAEAFIKKNGHLPGVKSYGEVMKNGFKLDLTEATITNLEKIEEQFLYITQLKEKIKHQNIAHKKQEGKIKSLEDRLAAIEKLLKE